MTGQATNVCTLITASCTTGWLDQIHAELWFCADGLLRRSVGLLGTIRHGDMRGLKPTVDPENRPVKTFDLEEIRSIVASSRRNHWIAWEDIASASLKRGVLDHTLRLELRDGSSMKLMWLRMDGGFDDLREALSQNLGSRFST